MDSPSIDRVTSRQNAKGGRGREGFSLLEMMMVVMVILIVASISTPIYMTAVVRAREAAGWHRALALRSLRIAGSAEGDLPWIGHQSAL